MMRYGRGRVRLLRKHPKTFSLIRLSSGGFSGRCCRRTAPGVVERFVGLIYVGVLGAYGAALLLFSIGLCVRRARSAIVAAVSAGFPGDSRRGGGGSVERVIAGSAAATGASPRRAQNVFAAERSPG